MAVSPGGFFSLSAWDKRSLRVGMGTFPQRKHRCEQMPAKKPGRNQLIAMLGAKKSATLNEFGELLGRYSPVVQYRCNQHTPGPILLQAP